MNRLKKEPRITVIGGGTGLSNLLRGFKKYTSNLTAIVAVTDDGGSSGKLRKELGVLPPGDIRNCLVALSEEETLMAKLFQYRFPLKGSLSGHSFGNLFLTAMSDLAGSFDEGIAIAGKVLAIKGKVLPVTLSSVELRAKLSDGHIVKGESRITKSNKRVKHLEMYPSRPPAAPKVIDAILSADAVVMGPGSLYTSVIANLLVDGVGKSLKYVKVPKIYICNIMTQSYETKDHTLRDHIDAITSHAGGDIVDYVVVNTAKIPANVLTRYAMENQYPVKLDKINKKVVMADLVSSKEYAHHDPDKLAAAVMKIINGKGV